MEKRGWECHNHMSGLLIIVLIDISQWTIKAPNHPTLNGRSFFLLNSISIRAANPVNEMFSDALEETQIALVIAMGGTKEYWGYMEFYFFGSFYGFKEGAINREELLERAQEAIEEDLKGEIPTNVVKG
ncbi:hypothetical protein [Salipaludibacillus agaradhaerens]|uniref:hypothetical protein n=1 Tax=Salipaludibacillus agaradhaerens TaxID=76935 RepID=UPI0009963917|nr:hypothetical protein [Salipaludibacillus agaradhaerens]